MMELEGHKALVTSIIVVPASTPASKILCYCWTSSLDGTLCYWDFSLPELLKKVDICLPIFSTVIPNLSGPLVGDNGKPVDLFAYISVEDITKPDDKDKASRGQIRKSIACVMDGSSFAILALLPKSSKTLASDENSQSGKDGVILLFNVENPVPLSTWSVNKAKAGGLAFLLVDPSFLDKKISEEKASQPQALLAYINGDHEYVIFDPYNGEDNKIRKNHQENLVPQDETGHFGYTSIYGELREFDIRRDQTPEIPYAASEKPWETIFSGSSHILPPLTKLCSTFLESLLEKRLAIQE